MADEKDTETIEESDRVAGLMASPDDDSEGAPSPGGALDQVLPVLPLRNSVLYPGALMPLAVGRPKTLRLGDPVGAPAGAITVGVTTAGTTTIGTIMAGATATAGATVGAMVPATSP